MAGRVRKEGKVKPGLFSLILGGIELGGIFSMGVGNPKLGKTFKNPGALI